VVTQKNDDLRTELSHTIDEKVNESQEKMVAMMDQRFEELTANMQFQLRDGTDNRRRQLQLTNKEET
jgi:hypothetical protein